jgi:hypothetical protein
VKYPGDFVVRKGSKADYPSGALFPPSFFIGPPVVRIGFPESEYQDSNLLNASLSVHVYDQPEALGKCLQGVYTQQELSEREDINGINFYKDYWGEGGMGFRYDVLSYRTIDQQSCYAINLVTYWSQIAPEGGKVLPFNKDKVSEIFDQILSTFRFLE